MDTRAHVVIVGGGFAGLTCAKALAKAKVRVTLLDRENHHCFQPLLYQCATAALAPNDIAWPIREILRDAKNVTTLLAEVKAVDLARKQVTADEVVLSYDYLVLATGVTHAYFGHDEWAPFAPGLKRVQDAIAIRRRVLEAFERAERISDPVEQQRLMTFVVVGGGPTGVEMAGAISELAHEALSRQFRNIDPGKARIVLLEAGKRLLAQFPEDLAGYALKVLKRRRVDVRTETAVTLCDEQGVIAGGERIPAGAVMWAAGVAAYPLQKRLGLEMDRAGRINVGPTLEAVGQAGVFIVGDAAAVKDEAGKPVPGVAPAAKQMGAYVAKVIRARAEGKRAPGAFRYRHAGDLATIGRDAAIVKLHKVKLRGFVAWVFWSAAHVYFLIGARNRIAVAFNWMWDYVTRQRGVRLITLPAGSDQAAEQE
jgi:NADH:ubiquinone reductase (H+-translocating)